MCVMSCKIYVEVESYKTLRKSEPISNTSYIQKLITVIDKIIHDIKRNVNDEVTVT